MWPFLVVVLDESIEASLLREVFDVFGQLGNGRRIADGYDVSQCRALAESIFQCNCLRSRRDECRHIAIVQDVLNLGRLKYRVDQYEYATSQVGREERNDSFDALIQVDSNALARPQTKGNRARGSSVHFFGQRSVIENISTAK